ncbi:hypothetical protein D3C87_367780 [compost metagenome]
MKKTLNVLLWTAQILVSGTLLWAAFVKLVQPIEALEKMWPWTGEIPPAFVRLTGAIDLLGALGLLLPMLLRFKPILTPVAALGIVLLMVCAIIFHISRGEASQIGFNVVFALLAAFIAFGRFKTIASN